MLMSMSLTDGGRDTASLGSDKSSASLFAWRFLSIKIGDCLIPRTLVFPPLSENILVCWRFIAYLQARINIIFVPFVLLISF